MINLEVPRKFIPLLGRARAFADEVMRPISRKYDRAEHAYPVELDLVSAVIDGLTDAGAGHGAGVAATRTKDGSARSAVAAAGSDRKALRRKENRNGANLSSVLSVMETCRGDVGLALSIPRQGLGNAAIAAQRLP